ncbi:hypothetical protein FHT00_000540 [Sphingomonas insulae]|uniref:DUF4402 domain-containing protein n=1 Tax=Sphingomonas insulae TaxID=424800 RepID=A0ABP3T7P6_9SPHN|nr:hypothetical protein [Sphingomonas insulae]NIJ28612.1 hypothetical protein [Sphingomonas insulae]
MVSTMVAGCAVLSVAVPAAAQSVPNMPSTADPQPLARNPLMQRLIPGTIVQNTARLGGNLRLRVAVGNAGEGPRDRLHQRVASSMVEFYPVGDSGFHLSAGTRLYDTRAGEQATNRGLMVVPRQLNVPGGKIGLKRTPALTMGYTGMAEDGTTIGLEIGAMKGSAYTDANDMARRNRAERAGGNPVNPMVNLVVGRRF